MIWKAGIVQLGIFCERLVRNGVLSNECRGFVYKINRMDPWIEPFCGMPKLSKVGCESVLLTVTVCVLLEKQNLNQLRGVPEIP